MENVTRLRRRDKGRVVIPSAWCESTVAYSMYSKRKFLKRRCGKA